MFDAELLSRLQFAFTASFHFIFPPFSIGVGLLLVIFESCYLITKKKIYEKITRFWIKIFAANFSLGVATGIVLEFEFGTNWASYSRFVGDVFGSPLAAEGIFAFFLESGFLAILLFGWNRVRPAVHLFSTIMVFTGSVLSGMWIIAANSWMHTPTGYEIVGVGDQARAQITDFWAMVFNPSFAIRYLHTIVGSFIQGAFLVLSVSAYYLIRNKHLEFAKKSFTAALLVAAVCSVSQAFIGHESAKVTAKYQPAKLAAFEGVYLTLPETPLYVFGWTDEEKQITKGLAIPGGLSFLTHGDFNTPVTGLDRIPREDWPPVNKVFQSYHLMISIGVFLIFLTLTGTFLFFRKKLFDKKWLLMVFTGSVFLPIIANQAGWFTTEVGRQPWIVQGLMRTSQGISKSVKPEEIMISLVLFAIIYSLLLFSWLYVLNKEIQHGPESPDDQSEMQYGKMKNFADHI